MTILSERITKSREQMGWSQVQLAAQLTKHREQFGRGSVTQQSISQLELGIVSSPRFLFDLSQVLDVDIQWLMGDKMTPAGYDGRTVL